MTVDSSSLMSDTNMSILTFLPFDDEPFNIFSDRQSISMARRDTRNFKVVPKTTQKIRKQYQEFCTGSAYIGEWNTFGFYGQGTYIYPHGVEYEGRFNKIGQFHGLGTLTYPSGQRLHGVWKNGKLFEYAYVFNCGEEVDESFTYCQMPDRRFHVEVQRYFGPCGQEYLTADQPTKEIPSDCYDTVDGIYNPQYKFIMSQQYYDNHMIDYSLSPEIESCKRRLSHEFLVDGQVIREIPTEEKTRWIKENCRKAWDEPTGYRPDLYENWGAGRRKDSLFFEYQKPQSITIQIKRKPRHKLISFIKKIKKPHISRFSVFSQNRSV